MTASPPVTASPLSDLQVLGQSAWFDNMRRALLSSGELERMMREGGLSGLTSNPSIFEKAIVGSTDYDDALAELRGGSPPDAKSVYEGLAIADLRGAADVFRAVYEHTDAGDGYVSMEVSPELVHDTAERLDVRIRLAGPRSDRPARRSPPVASALRRAPLAMADGVARVVHGGRTVAADSATSSRQPHDNRRHEPLQASERGLLQMPAFKETRIPSEDPHREEGQWSARRGPGPGAAATDSPLEADLVRAHTGREREPEVRLCRGPPAASRRSASKHEEVSARAERWDAGGRR